MPARTAVFALLVCVFSGCRVDHGLEPRPSSWSGIEGTVVFLGEWLEEVEEARVAVYPDYPPADYFALAGFSDPLPLGVSNCSYRVPLVEGRYEWVVVAARKRSLGWVDGYLLLGQYTGSPGETGPAPVTVSKNESTRGVNIVVDFSDLPEPPPIPKAGQAGAGFPPAR